LWPMKQLSVVLLQNKQSDQIMMLNEFPL